MIHHMLSQLSIFSAVAVLLLLPDSCRGQSAVIGPLQPIVASVGDNVTLPCHLEPAVDAAAITFEWTRADLSPRFVHVWRSGENLMDLQNPAYKDRTSVSEEKLKSGDISLKLSNVKPSDEGKYRCFIPGWKKESFVELVVDAASTFFIVGIDRGSDGVVLDCESRGWYPEPEVFWLDGEGNLLSAGPTETVRGPDDLYTVSSRVTVEKRHSNSFTCRVQQNHTNQIRETHIHVQDNIFKTQYSFGTVIALAVFWALSLFTNLFLWIRYCRKRY
ncbi:butyrophilin subfamily 3 member A2-like [Acanthopagrus latus]|uniref:butyrophilin subfamily 3 member A2-like n=1 Tax=Acanthopagrus latus TaxID=8177 RepID=UPI00187C0313|nr:butyrophilin subfamily 3 member A2-like [Acanthopagrus latus]